VSERERVSFSISLFLSLSFSLSLSLSLSLSHSHSRSLARLLALSLSLINNMICSFVTFEEDGSPTPGTNLPMVDGGTEGLAGHVNVIYPGVTPCFECILPLFPPQVCV